jgi:hypothetical protein
MGGTTKPTPRHMVQAASILARGTMVRLRSIFRTARQFPGQVMFWMLIAAEEIGALLRRKPGQR